MKYLILLSILLICSLNAVCQWTGIPITYLHLKHPAYYPCGRDSLGRFLRKSLPAEWHSHYMPNLYVVVKFIVKQDSTLCDFTFVSGNKKHFEDVINAIKKSEPWIPGVYENKAVQTSVELKVKFPQPG